MVNAFVEKNQPTFKPGMDGNIVFVTHKTNI